jgi:hypothetical protein
MAAVQKWSQAVTANSNALDLDQGVFALKSAAAIAASLKRSADRSQRRKSTPYQSAMSMLNFYNQPSRQEPAGEAAAPSGKGQRRIAQVIRKRSRLSRRLWKRTATQTNVFPNSCVTRAEAQQMEVAG